MAIWPDPSIVDVAVTRRLAADALPIQAILLPLIATAPSRITLFLPSMVTTSQPLSSRSTFCGWASLLLALFSAMRSALLQRGVHFRQLVAARRLGGGIHRPDDGVAVQHQQRLVGLGGVLEHGVLQLVLPRLLLEIEAEIGAVL